MGRVVGMGLVSDVWSPNRTVFKPSPAVLSAIAKRCFPLKASTETAKFCLWHARMVNVENRGHFLLDGGV